MATNGWGKGVDNNTINWGRGKDNATNNWGAIYGSSASGDTALEVSTPSFANSNSAEFDGVDDYIATNSTYSVLDGQTKMSISLWFYPTTTSVYQILFSTVRDSNANNFQIMAVFNNYRQVRFFTDSTGKGTFSNLSVFTLNAWNHLVVTLDLSQATADRCDIYLNGSNVTSGTNNQTISALTTSSSTMSFGINQNNKYNEFTGKLDEVAVWSGTTLSASDVTTIYNSGTPTDLSQFATPPTNWWRMGENDGGSGTTLTDASGSANATLYNGTSYGTDTP